MLLALGLLLQATALLAVLRQTGRRFPAYCGAMFVAMAVVYHGTTEVVQLVLPDRSIYRLHGAPTELDTWIITVSIALTVPGLLMNVMSIGQTWTGGCGWPKTSTSAT